MAQILDKQGLQHYANKMCNADNRKVGSKNLPTALNEIDTAIDGFKTLFETEYGSALNMELENNENVFSIGTGTNIDKKDDVENSFTDLKISGNTLVNLMPKITSGDYIQLNATTNWVTSSYHSTGKRLKPNTKYTVILDVHANSLSSTNNFHVNIDHKNAMAFTEKWTVNSLGRHVKLFTTKAELLDNMLAPRTQIEVAEEGKYVRYSIVLLEGDWTNKPIPQYFEGLKSVGEKEDGNHKISILSFPSNPNLIQTHCTVPSKANWSGNVTDSPTELIEDISCPNGKYIKILSNSNDKTELGRYVFPTERLEIGKKYSWSFWCKSNKNLVARCGAEQGGTKMINITPTWQKFTHTFTATNSVYWAFIFYLRNAQVGDYICVHSIKLEEGESITDWCPNDEETYKNLVPNYSKFDKKEISLNEPLRSVGDTKDTIEKINGEWKIVRRCRGVVLNGTENWTDGSNGGITDPINKMFALDIHNKIDNKNINIISDKMITYNADYTWRTDVEGMSLNANGTLQIRLNPKKISNNTNNASFKNWLSQNPLKCIHKLETPIIEDISPITLQCWKNGTISIDEVIPAETTHTVALNKSAQIQKNIEELTLLRNRAKALEKQYDNSTLNQAYELELLRFDMELDNII